MSQLAQFTCARIIWIFALKVKGWMNLARVSGAIHDAGVAKVKLSGQLNFV